MATEPGRNGRRPLTDEQRRALNSPGVSVALSAGAGCGKTFVLTERFVGALAPHGEQSAGARLGQVVAITFTERAAREMRDRIRAACRARLLDCPEGEVGYWLALLRELDTARINTIHGFCGTLLRSHAVEARLDPRFRVLDAAQSDTLRREAADTVLREVLAESSEETIELLVTYGFAGLTTMVDGLLGQRDQIDWAAWQAEAPENLVNRWEDHWRAVTLPAALKHLASSPVARQLLELAGVRPCSQAAMLERFAVLGELLPGLAESAHAAADVARLHEVARVQGSRAKQWASDDVYEQFKVAAEALRKSIEGVRPLLSFDRIAALPAARDGLRMLAIAGRVAAEYDARKDDESVLDFDDLLIRAKQLLVGPGSEPLRRRLAGQIRLLLVDEFQDTDPLQVELVRALCDDGLLGGKLFFVGDLKQSIYRFRGAQPEVFRALRSEMPETGRLPLSLNFRSQPGVIDFVNALFAPAIDAYEPLRAHRPQSGPRPSVELLWASEPKDETGDESGSRAGRAERLRRTEAEWIARRIRQMLDSGEMLVGTVEGSIGEEGVRLPQAAARPVAQGDIAILFRALTDVQYYEEALRRYGIEYYLVGGKAFYSQQEVYDLVNLLRAIDNPADDVSLLGALRGPLFSLTDETIVWLKLGRQSLHEGLMAPQQPQAMDAAQRERVAHAAQTLRELGELKDRVGVAHLIREALARTGFDAVLLAEFLGERKLANLHKLIDQARADDQQGIFTLDDYIQRLSDFVARQPDEALAATYPEKADVVRLMSIHQSKGLEFPVVFVADVARPRMAGRDAVRFTPALGPLIRSQDGALTGFDLDRLATQQEDEAEMVRLFYVAATRAADYLVLSAGVEDLEKPQGPWMELLATQLELATGNSIGEATLAGPVAKAVCARPDLFGKPKGGPRGLGLTKALEQIEQAIAAGETAVPPLAGAIPPDANARQRFSFSSLHGALTAAAAEEAVAGEFVVGGNSVADGFVGGESLRRSGSATKSPFPVGSPTGEGSRVPQDAAEARELGTLVHAVLEEIDFARPNNVRELVARFAPAVDDAASDVTSKPAVSSAGSATLAIELIERFVASPRAAELASAKQLHRELEFLLCWPPDGAPADGDCQKYIEGFIDCLYQGDDGRWRILDYKTNQVTAATLPAVAAGYEMQMLLYALAAEQVLGEPPVELVLHFLRVGQDHVFFWDASARNRLCELMNPAMSAVSSSW